ncbi:MAG: 5'/3'-nucleotidase SurE [Candidatus Marinimicrobia bacterium]|nr:5'/3'-nucleotidase SurE [Candidatus Neomarinimicrobiota bacterium]RKY61959.1 MAG: 5'/3'-nucleotidase SurE [Candidatus Neomarinimicrobiota bacterium]
MKKTEKPFILATNDDGIAAPGIHALVTELRKHAEVAVVAPDSEKSAVGHAITLSDPIRVTDFSKSGQWQGFAVSGTPSDCVKIAVGALLDRRPDMVISGINLGSNAGINVIYSGTVSAATEGTILGIPSIAVSVTTYTEPIFQPAARFAVKMMEIVLAKGLPERTLLNINIPNLPGEKITGVRITRQGMANFAETFDKRVDPRNRVYYWMDGQKEEIQASEDVDDEAVKRGCISITPIKYDLTNYDFMEDLQHWLPEINV